MCIRDRDATADRRPLAGLPIPLSPWPRPNVTARTVPVMRRAVAPRPRGNRHAHPVVRSSSVQCYLQSSIAYFAQFVTLGSRFSGLSSGRPRQSSIRFKECASSDARRYRWPFDRRDRRHPQMRTPLVGVGDIAMDLPATRLLQAAQGRARRVIAAHAVDATARRGAGGAEEEARVGGAIGVKAGHGTGEELSLIHI